MKILLAIAVIPSILLLYYIYNKDKVEKEPGKLLFKLFIYGAITTIGAIILERLLGSFWSRTVYYTNTIQYAFYDAFLTVAVVEEGLKYYALRKASFKDSNFNCTFDGIIYSVFVSLGFATIENIMYVFNYGIGTGIARAVLSVPGHMTFSVFMGVYYSKAKQAYVDGYTSSYTLYTILSLLLPILVHGFYDFCLMAQTDGLYICFFIFVILIDVVAFKTIKRVSREDTYF